MPKFKTSGGYKSPINYGSKKSSPIRKGSPKFQLPKIGTMLNNLVSNVTGNVQKSLMNLSGNLFGIKNQQLFNNIASSKQPLKTWFEHLKTRKPSGFSLSKADKAQAKKLGMSEYQWRSGVGITPSQRHHKRMYDKRNKPSDLSSKEIKRNPYDIFRMMGPIE